MLLGLLCISSQVSFSQTFTVTNNNTAFTINTTGLVEAGTTRTSAFALNVNSRNSAYNLTAAVTAKTFNPASTTFSPVPLKISLRSITGVATSGGVTGAIQLLESPPGSSTLATNATRTGNSATAIWTYDIIVSAIGYTIPPGSYAFTVRIQYTDGGTTITRTFPITLTVQSVLNISFIQNSSNTINFTTSAHYLSGITSSNIITQQVKSNLAWLVNVASQSTYFTPASSGADNNMPCSVISIKPTTSTNFTPLSITNSTLKTGNAGNTGSTGNSFNVDMNFNTGYNYNAGIYNLSIIYTLTNQ